MNGRRTIKRLAVLLAAAILGVCAGGRWEDRPVEAVVAAWAQ